MHWTELPQPLLGDDGSFAYFTGSVVVDAGNTSGLGANSVVAAYTMHRDSNEAVGLSSSLDGVDFHFFPGNPVLDVGSASFRDPQVFWHAQSKRWVMVIALPDARKVSFYSSPNLRDWKHESDFGPLGAQGGVWETPDLFPLRVDGQAQAQKWVLSIGVSPNRMQYFVGSFSGSAFTLDESARAFLKRGVGLEGMLFAAFDGSSYDGWTPTGTAFGQAPATQTGPVHIGAGYVDSIGGSDSEIGTLTSPPFTIEKPCINFLLAGGHHPNQTCVNLLLDGAGEQVARTSTGDGTGVLKWSGWDVSELRGRRARIQIVDSYTGSDFGHLMADHFLFSDRLQSQGSEHALWSDIGSDFYAARSWRDVHDSTGRALRRTSWIGWLGNWEYARDVPTSYGKGFESIPRDLELRAFPEGLRLVQAPIQSLQSLRGRPKYLAPQSLRQGTTALSGFAPRRNTYEIEAEFDTSQASTLGLNLLVGHNRKLVLGYNARIGSLFVDRTLTSDFTSSPGFNSTFARRVCAPVAAPGNRLRLRVFVDKSSVEVFANQGEAVLSVLTFPGEDQTGIEAFSQGGGALSRFRAWELRSIWDQDTRRENRIPGIIQAQSFNARSKSGSRNSQPAALSPTQASRERGHQSVSVQRGEWLSYSVRADWPGAYIVSARLSGRGGTFHLELDGTDVTGPVDAPGTGGSQSQLSVARHVNIPLGEHRLSLVVDRGRLNIDGLKFSWVGSEIVSGGIYRISARAGGHVLEPSGPQEGAAIQQWKPRNDKQSANQKWKIEAAGPGLYTLTVFGSGKALAVTGDANGTTVLQQAPTGGKSQQWAIRDIGGGYYAIASRSSGKVLDLRENSRQNGGVVQLWEGLSSVNQAWKLERIHNPQAFR